MDQQKYQDIDDPTINPVPPNLSSCAATKQWVKIGTKNHHGINIPIFSLRSAKSAGIGEYLDLLPILDWHQEVGMDVLQLLPLNDTGLDTSPYNSLTANGLNPLFISLAGLPGFDSSEKLKEIYADLQALNSEKRVMYEAVRKGKEQFFQEYLQIHGKEIAQSSAYQLFESKNNWLTPYALFKTLKETSNWQSWHAWELQHPEHNQELFNKLLDMHKERIGFHKFLQFFAFEQLGEVKQKAEAGGIRIKGDIPILISAESADVWCHPQYFYHHFAAGAPPDMYSAEGQYWGFPIYNWRSLEKHGYDWWTNRLQVASQLYHLYRLDHIVGFYRIWAIPEGKKAIEGHYVPENPALWLEHGEKIMNMMLSSSDLLPIGEDLGVVPNRVKNSLTRLGICGTKVMRWERDWHGDKSYLPVQSYPRLSMTTVSTHDSDTLQLWWKDSPEDAKLFAASQGWSYEEKLSSEQQLAILRMSHQSHSIFHINLLQEYLTLFPEFSWESPEEEKINIPGTFNGHNWTYRFRPAIEEWTSSLPLQGAITHCLSP